MHGAQQSRVRCWGPFSLLLATANHTDLKQSVGAGPSRCNSRVNSSGTCWLRVSEGKIQKIPLNKPIFINYVSPHKGSRCTYRMWENLAMQNFPGVYHCPPEKSLGAVAAQPDPATSSCCTQSWKGKRKLTDKNFGCCKIGTKQILLYWKEVWHHYRLRMTKSFCFLSPCQRCASLEQGI